MNFRVRHSLANERENQLLPNHEQNHMVQDRRDNILYLQTRDTNIFLAYHPKSLCDWEHRDLIQSYFSTKKGLLFCQIQSCSSTSSNVTYSPASLFQFLSNNIAMTSCGIFFKTQNCSSLQFR